MSDKPIENFRRCISPQQKVEMDSCTLCGECLKQCPVQQVKPDKSISPPEKIRMFREFIKGTEGLKAMLLGKKEVNEELLKHFVQAVYECTTCGACTEGCTVGIYTQRLWPALRREMVLRGLGPIGGQKNMPMATLNTGNVYNFPAADRFSPWWPATVSVAESASYAYYAGCTGAYEAKPMVRGDALVLGAMGLKFTMLSPEEEVCCGFPLFITGQHDILAGLVKRLVEGYAARGVSTLICSCPCCVNMMSRDWPLLYGKKLPFAIKHISQIVVEALKSGQLKITKGTGESLIYHDPCYLSRGVGIVEEPRRVLRAIPGSRLLEFDANRANSRCCGAGGAARKVFSDTAMAIARLSIDEAVAKGADRLMLGCPACYGKVNESMEGHDKKIRITDVMELVAELL